MWCFWRQMWSGACFPSVKPLQCLAGCQPGSASAGVEKAPVYYEPVPVVVSWISDMYPLWVHTCLRFMRYCVKHLWHFSPIQHSLHHHLVWDGFSNITTHTHQWRPPFDRWAVELGQPYRKVLSLCPLHVWCKSMCFNGKQGCVFHLRSLINTNHSCKKNTAGTWCCEGKQPLKYQRNNPGIFS